MIFFAFWKRGVILNNMLRLIRSPEAAPWCNGSTSDSGSFCWGSNPYGAAIFFALKKAKNTKSQDFSSLCRRHNFTQKTKFFLHIFTCTQKSCLWRRCISFRLRRRFIPLTLHCTCEVFSHTRVRFVEFFNAHLSVLKRRRMRHFFCLEKGKKNMKPVKASLHTAPAVLHTLRKRKVLHAA